MNDLLLDRRLLWFSSSVVNGLTGTSVGERVSCGHCSRDGQAGMDELYEHDTGLRALAMRVAALEDNVAFLEEWCEEQQDVLDRAVGPVTYDYEIEAEPEPAPRAVLRVVDLRDEVLAVLEAATDDAEALVDDPGFDEPSLDA